MLKFFFITGMGCCVKNKLLNDSVYEEKNKANKKFTPPHMNIYMLGLIFLFNFLKKGVFKEKRNIV